MTRSAAKSASGRKGASSGRAGAKRAAGGKQRRVSLSLGGKEAALLRIGKPAWRRLARRGGVLRISEGCYDVRHGMPRALADFLRRVLDKAVVMAEYAKRYTIIPNDISYAIKQLGMTIYYTKDGMDWTYGKYSRTYVRARIMAPLDRQVLAEAAAARAASELSGRASNDAPTPRRAPSTAAAAEEQQQAAGLEARFEAAAAAQQGEQQAVAEEAAEQQEAQGVAPPSVARSTVRPQAAAGMDVDALAAAQEAAAAQPAAAEAQPLLSPEAQQPAAAAKGGAAPATAVVPAVRRLSDIPTPDVMTEARALEVQAWMSELIQGPLSVQGWVNRQHLKKVMLAKHACSPAEFQDVLFGLERSGRVMLDGDDIFLCN